jgi:endonuclease/exonuclease/phosphatase (EEP) superfamily protein YafD
MVAADLTSRSLCKEMSRGQNGVVPASRLRSFVARLPPPGDEAAVDMPLGVPPLTANYMLLLKWALGLSAAALAVVTAAPLIRTNAWWVRIFDFPRMQLAALLTAVLAGYGVVWSYGGLGGADWTMLGLATASLAWHAVLIARYTSLTPIELKGARQRDRQAQLSLLIYNVLYDNHDVGPLLRLIERTGPDLVLLVEPTARWKEELSPLEQTYPYTILQPQENEYGMLLYSRLELVDPEVRFLIEEEIPSIRTKVRLRSGDEVALYGLHPRPPGIERPDAEGRQDSDQRDGELLLVAKEVAEHRDAPTIVAGDFNDVAWSHTTRLFRRKSRLLDPRIGRGMYNTYDADSYVLRYPLDHVFASDHFRLVELRRLEHLGSDHFPIYVALSYEPEAADQQEAPKPKPGDAQEAEEAIDEAKSNQK